MRERETTILIYNKFANGADHHLIATIIEYGTICEYLSEYLVEYSTMAARPLFACNMHR